MSTTTTIQSEITAGWAAVRAARQAGLAIAGSPTGGHRTYHTLRGVGPVSEQLMYQVMTVPGADDICRRHGATLYRLGFGSGAVFADAAGLTVAWAELNEASREHAAVARLRATEAGLRADERRERERAARQDARLGLVSAFRAATGRRLDRAESADELGDDDLIRAVREFVGGVPWVDAVREPAGELMTAIDGLAWGRGEIDEDDVPVPSPMTGRRRECLEELYEAMRGH